MMVQCPACRCRMGDSNAIRYHGKVWMFQCPSCLFAFVHPLPSLSENEELYDDAYSANPDAERKTRKLAQDYLHKIRTFLPSEGQFLEIGGSHGWLSEAVVQTTRCKVTMLEPGRTAANAAKSRGLNTVCAFVHQYHPEQPFDVLFAGHVAEHLPDLDAFLSECRELIQEGGKLILLTPNACAWKFRLLKGNWGWAAVGNHLQFLSPKSASLLLQRNGFSVDTIRDLRPGNAHYPIILTRLLSSAYTRLFGRVEQAVQPFPPHQQQKGAPSPGTHFSIKQMLAGYGRKAGRPLLWAERGLLFLLDTLMGHRDELLIVATARPKN